MYKRTRWGLSAVALLVAMCIWVIVEVPVELGIDLQGGTELTYQLDLSRIDRDRAEVADRVKDIISKRLNAYGLKELSISVQGQDRLVIQLPGSDSSAVETLKKQIETAGNLTFRLAAVKDEQSPEKMKAYEEQEREYVAAEKEWVRRKVEDPSYSEQRPRPPDYLVRWEVEREPGADKGQIKYKQVKKWTLENFHNVYNDEEQKWEPQGIVSGQYLSGAHETVDNQYRRAIGFQFKGEGATMFGELTGANIKRLLAIVLDDDVMQVATIQSQITDRGQLTGDFTADEIRGIVTILRGGSLPTKPQLISQSTVGATLGQDSIQSGIRAVIVGAAGVMLFMAIYYMIGGMVADLALALNLLLIFAYVVLFRQTLTLPGLAGVILTLGMAVDANILIFERYREERKKGKPMVPSLSAGYSRAFWVIFDSNLTTIMTGFVLFYLGTPEVKGFAVTLISGIFASFFTSVFVTRFILSGLINIGLLKNMKILEVLKTPRVPFTKYRRRFVAGSVIVILVTWSLVFWRGNENYGIDFTGGARVTMNLREPVRVEDMRKMLDGLRKKEPELFRDYVIQTVHPESPGLSSTYAVLTRAGSESSGLVKEAEAQEKPASPKPAEKPAAEKPAAEKPAAEKPAAEKPAAEKPVLGAATVLPQRQEAKVDPAQRVRKVLEDMLAERSLLLPPSFPRLDWVRDPTPGAIAGSEYLVMEVNLIEVGTDYTTDRVRSEINARFEEDPLLRRGGRAETDVYKGLEVTSVELVAKRSAENPVERYRITTSSYAAPPEGLRTERTTPTHQEVESAIRGYFHDKGAAGLRLSEPFPQVLTVGRRVSSTLQADALVALFISILGIVFYLSLRFEFIYGVAGIVALVHDAMITIGLMAVADQFLPDFSIKFNLTEMAAILSIVGYSINDTIVLFDRVRENLVVLAKRKYSLEDIVDLSVNQTLLRTIWTSLTTLLVIVLLLGFGGESVRGFAFLFSVGLVAGTYSSVFVASPVALWLHGRAEKRRKAAAGAPS